MSAALLLPTGEDTVGTGATLAGAPSVVTDTEGLLLLLIVTARSRSMFSMFARRPSKWSIFRSLCYRRNRRTQGQHRLHDMAIGGPHWQAGAQSPLTTGSRSAPAGGPPWVSGRRRLSCMPGWRSCSLRTANPCHNVSNTGSLSAGTTAGRRYACGTECEGGGGITFRSRH